MQDPLGILAKLSVAINVSLVMFVGRYLWPMGPARRLPGLAVALVVVVLVLVVLVLVVLVVLVVVLVLVLVLVLVVVIRPF